MTSARARLLLGAEHRCSYLEGRTARSVFVDPQLQLDPARYGALLDMGFRRSGGYVYRPACAACQQCRPARIPVADFAPNRSQRRCLKSNSDLAFTVGGSFGDEHFALYRRYLSTRHPDGGMDPNDRAAFESFLSCAWGDTEIWSFHAGPRLVAAAVVDRVPQGLSAVYTFFEPDTPARSLGIYAVLTQIAQARAEKRPYVYLGYWVPDSRTMDYKRHFHPLEVLTTQGWSRRAD